MNDSLIYHGSAVKALGGGKVGGYLVLFSDENSPDLAGDYFTKDTEFGPHTKTLAFYGHGLDKTVGRKVLDPAAVLSVKDAGVWVEAQLDLREDYEAAIYAMAKAGKLGWSSGTASHLVERETVGNAKHITKWPLGLDASLTPTPCEPRTSALPVKSLDLEDFDALKSGVMNSDRRKMLSSAVTDLGMSGYLDDFDEDTLYWYSYGDGGTVYYAIPFTEKKGVVTLGTPVKVKPTTVYQPVSPEGKSLGLSLSDHSQSVLAAVSEFVKRAEDYQALKAQGERPLSQEARKGFAALRDQLDAVLSHCSPSDAAKALRLEQMRIEADLVQTLYGVPK